MSPEEVEQDVWKSALPSLRASSHVAASHLHEPPEHFGTLVLVPRLVGGRGRSEARRARVPVAFERGPDVVDPKVDLRAVDLEMELRRPRPVADAKRLRRDLV